MVCKTIIRRFDSARHLQLLCALILGCSDPPSPPPASTSPSTARWVQWRAAADPVNAPVAVFVDAPGGPVDRLAADADVTTFLNDRFHPLFRVVDPAQAAGTVQFYTADGCAFGPPIAPLSAQALIDAANAVIVRPEAGGRRAPAFSRTCAGAPISLEVSPGANPNPG